MDMEATGKKPASSAQGDVDLQRALAAAPGSKSRGLCALSSGVSFPSRVRSRV
jgi:hypothetical protein